MKPVRVLHLVEHLHVGGAERVVVDLIRNLDERRIRSAVCLYRGSGAFVGELPEGCRVLRLRKDLLTRHLRSLPGPLLAPFVLLESGLFLLRLAALLRRHDFRVIHSHMFSANLWGALSARLAGGVGVVATEHTVRSGRRSFKRKIINRFLLPRCDRVVAVTDEVARTIMEEQDLSPPRLRVIPNGIDTEAFAPLEAQGADGDGESLPGGVPRVGIIGRLVPVKRVERFIAAMKTCSDRIPGVGAVVVGDGPERAGLERLAGEAGLGRTLFFLGERRDIPRILGKIDLLVNCSDREGLSRTLLEAMAAGVPVVATEVGGSGELIRGGEAGILVPPGDDAALADAICRLLSDPELRSRLRQNALKKVKEDYSMAARVKEWEKLYMEVFFEREKSR